MTFTAIALSIADFKEEMLFKYKVRFKNPSDNAAMN